MVAKTKRMWLLTNHHIIHAADNGENEFRMWVIPHPESDDDAFMYDGLFPSVVETVKWYEERYPAAKLDVLTVRYTNDARLVIETTGETENWTYVEWHIDNTGLEREPKGQLAEPINRPFSLSVENIMDGIPSLWKAVDDARSTS
jgi:hypothetical protein